MKDNITKRDWETISAYLDGQLSERKEARLESRLAQDEQLRVALDEIQNTQHVLRNTPSLRAPRSFMLTPEMAGQPHRLPRLAPVFGWASAVASFLLVLFLVGDLFTAGGAIPMALNNIPTQEELFAPQGQVAGDEVLAQPAANTSKIEDPSVGRADAAAPETLEGDIAPEAAAASEIESAPKEGPTPITKAIDLAAAEEPVSSDEDAKSDELVEEVDVSVALNAAPETEDLKPDPEADIRVEVAAATETLAVESTPEQHLLAPPVVEIGSGEVEQPEEESPLPAEEPTQPPVAMAMPTDEQTEQPPSLLDEPSNPETILTSDSETPLNGNVSTAQKQSGLLVGAEVILGLVALGAGFAWLFLRRRGG